MTTVYTETVRCLYAYYVQKMYAYSNVPSTIINIINKN